MSADTDSLDRVLRRLVDVGVLTRDDAGRYGLTPRGESLRDDHPSGDRARLGMTGAVGRPDLSLVQLLHSVRTGEAAYPRQFGLPFWEDLAADPELSASYAEQMAADVSADAPHIAAAYDWGALGHVVDVGGGNGALLVALLRAFPDLRGTVVDLPAIADAARTALAEAGLADRSDAVSGSFFDPLPAGAGGYVLSAIVHDWDDDSARAILRRCAEVAGSDGRVLIVEKIGTDGETIRTGMDLRVLAYVGGKERGGARGGGRVERHGRVPRGRAFDPRARRALTATQPVLAQLPLPNGALRRQTRPLASSRTRSTTYRAPATTIPPLNCVPWHAVDNPLARCGIGLLGRPASESGRLRQVDGNQERGDRLWHEA